MTDASDITSLFQEDIKTDGPDETSGTRLNEIFIKNFYKLLQAVRIHDDNNDLLIKCARSFLNSAAKLAENETHVTIRFLEKRIYMGESKLIYRRETVNLFDNVYDYFVKRGIQAVRFNVRLDECSVKQVLNFARLLHYAEQRKNPLEWILGHLARGVFPWAEIVQDEDAPKIQSKKEKAMRSYAHVLGSVNEITQKLSTQGTAGIRKTRRMVQNMVDMLMDDDPLFQALSTIRVYDDYTHTHSVNVALLSMCIGKYIMLSKRSLESLGICGLLHDLGKIEIPKGILNKPGKLTPDEFEEIKKHSMNSARLIVKIQASRDQKASILLAPFEHHLKYDLTGYPQTDRKKPISLFGRILTIADVYDAITSPRIYRSISLSPAQALRHMQDGAGKDFDPVLLKVFINMMGVYPLGTILKTDTGGMGLVTVPPEHAEMDQVPDKTRPWILLLKSDGNGGIKKGRVVHLGERNLKTGRYLRNVVETLSPYDFGIQPVDYIL
jgi:HD-GYP domain-containing protein (c-di-GMP phosphodiesterase class II)